jgi:hypothetical protein
MEAPDTIDQRQSRCFGAPSTPKLGDSDTEPDVVYVFMEEDDDRPVSLWSTGGQRSNYCGTIPSNVSTPLAVSSEDGLSHFGDVTEHWRNSFDELVNMGGIVAWVASVPNPADWSDWGQYVKAVPSRACSGLAL